MFPRPHLTCTFILLFPFICSAQGISWKNANIVSDIKPGWFNRYDTYSVISDEKGNSYCIGNYESDDEDYSAAIIPKLKRRSGTFINKFDAKGEPVWAIDAGIIRKIMPDKAGHLYAAGLDFIKDTARSDRYTERGKHVAFIAKISEQGDIVWKKHLSDEHKIELYELYRDEKDSLKLVFGSYIKAKTHPERTMGASTANDEFDLLMLFSTTFLPNGDIASVQRMETSGISKDCVERIYHDRGKLYITGDFSGKLKIGDTTFMPDRLNNAFIAVFEKNKFKWGLQFSREQYADRFHFPYPKLAFGEDGSIYMGGTYSSLAKFGNITLRGSAKENGFLVKYSSAGKPMWAKSLGTPQSAESEGASVDAIAMDKRGNIWFSGHFNDELVLGRKTYVADKTLKPKNKDDLPNHVTDLYIASTDPSGNILESRTVTGSADKFPVDLYPDEDGNFTMIGVFAAQTIKFDDHPISTRGISTFIARMVIQKSQPVTAARKKPSAAPVAAQEKTNTEDLYATRKWAVIAGISDYSDPAITDLRFASKDAELFYNFLKSPEGGGVPDEQIVFLSGPEATRSAIISALSQTFRQATQNDIIIFYIASHGEVISESKELYLLPFDADPANVEGTAISEAEVQKFLTRSQAGKKLIIADACHSGSLGLDRNMRSSNASLVNQKLLELATYKNGTAILSASSSAGVSLENSDVGHGEFTYYLVEGLKGKADANNDRLVSIREAFNYVNKKVVSSTSGTQHPELKGTFSDDMPLGANQAGN